MSGFLDQVAGLIRAGEVRISEHGYDRLLEDGLTAKEVVEGADEAAIVEEYPDYPKGRCALCLQRDRAGQPLHAVWGIPRGRRSPLVLVTAYRPDPERWDEAFLRRL